MFKLVHKGNFALGFFYLPSLRIVFLFRLSQFLNLFILTKPLSYIVTIINDFVHGVWIGPGVSIDGGLYLGHPRGLVINPSSIIGKNCAILQRVTLGGPNIKIGDNVALNAGVQIINDPLKDTHLEIGDNCIIGAGSIVVRTVPCNSVVIGVPGKIVKTIPSEENWIHRRIKQNAK